MKPGIKRRWIKALRSGKYTQTHGQLKRGKKAHCCLGVLCDLAPPSVGSWEKLTFSSKSGDDSSIPPQTVRDWAELRTGDAFALARRNDAGSSFEEIADYIEANL